MKDLILITSYHPDNIRENILRELVYNLYSFKNEFDLAIVSHTPIPLDIQNKVNFALYDDKNEILTDSTLLNKPWFAPIDRKIMSSYLTGKNTHLAIWRMFILGFSLAQNMGYKKIHNIEYDASIKNINELKDNSKLLDTYKSIYYLENEFNVDSILFGSIQSYNVDYIHPTLLNLDEDNIKNMIRKSNIKSPEGMLKDLIHEVGDYFVKDRKDLETEYNTFAKSNDNQQFNPWGVPYYDKLEKNIKFITWNTTNIKGITNNIIINSEKMINTGNIKYNCWKIVELGKIENINHIIIMENNKVKNEINLFSNEEKDEFKKMSFSEES
tara:strand:- start:3822 stop:4802 length:981 start_codon:yes stop_codon:yes gene_type:complete